jgi:carbon monoxide dehydrogenase subunit G
MFVETQVSISGAKKSVWSVITDIENAASNISGIDQVEILEQPSEGLVGLKWRETRTVMGKSATEEMWITEAVENEHYKARAESHGFIYISTLRVTEEAGTTLLSMSHDSSAQSFGAKLMSIPMGLFFKGMMKKAFLKDLNDIKGVVEQS